MIQGKWLPMNLDGGFHSCNQNKKVETNNKKEPTIVMVNQQARSLTLSLEELNVKFLEIEASIKRLEKLLTPVGQIDYLIARIKKIESFLFLAAKK